MATTTTPHSKACCTLPPVVSDYKPCGDHVTLPSGLDAYCVGPKDAKHAILVIYDIFGYWPTTFQSVDLLAHATCARLIMPDFFKGKPWPLANFPPSNETELPEWIGKHGDFETNVVPELESAIKYAKGAGAAKIGMVGMCWGGKMTALAAVRFKLSAITLIHPAFLTVDLLTPVNCPTCVLPSKDEPDMREHEAVVLKSSPVSVFHRFDDMHHGWCAARADFSNDLNCKRTHEALTIVSEFFIKAF